MNRIVGLETEYGCLTSDFPGTPSAITRVRDWIFKDQRFGLIDVHQRDWDEPAGNGGFLFNGGRCYIDMGHLEYCTPECLSLLDVLRYDQAGDAILLQALRAMQKILHQDFSRLRAARLQHFFSIAQGRRSLHQVIRVELLKEIERNHLVK